MFQFSPILFNDIKKKIVSKKEKKNVTESISRLCRNYRCYVCHVFLIPIPRFFSRKLLQLLIHLVRGSVLQGFVLYKIFKKFFFITSDIFIGNFVIRILCANIVLVYR